MSATNVPTQTDTDIAGSVTLKQKQTTALGKVTRKRNEVVKLMLSVDNLHEVKNNLAEYDQLFILYQKAHGQLFDVLTSEDDQDRESKRYREHEAEISDFRKQVIDWISEAEHKLSDDLDHLSEKRTKRSGLSQSTHRSRTSSTLSARAREKAKLAALLVEREQQAKQFELQAKQFELQTSMQKLQVEEKKLQLDLEISKAVARERVFTEELGKEDQSLIKTDHSSLHMKVGTHIVVNMHVHSPSVVDNVNDFVVTESNNHMGVDHTGHFYVNAIAKDKVGSVSSFVNTIYHDMRNPVARCHQVGPTQSALNPKATSFQPVYVPQVDYHKSIQELVTAMTLPQPEVPKFAGDPTELHIFLMAFDARIVSRTTNYADRLYYLNQYLEGEAKDFISGCLHMDPKLGYLEARSILQKEYGDLYKVSSAYIDKVMSWSTIKQDDTTSLKTFAILLVRCLKAMPSISSMTILNHLPNLKTIVLKLPAYLQNKWREQVHKIRKNEDRSPNFQDLT
jgi:hypothetical protein